MAVIAVAAVLAVAPSIALAAPPTNTSPPTIVSDPANTAIVTGTLADDGSIWTAPLLSVSYQWEDCDANGNSCTAIPAATAPTYVVQPSDLGRTLRVVETGTNADGSTTATSAPSVLVTEIPQNTTAPSISGDPAVGKTLTVSRGVWAPASEAISYSYQWVLCEGYCFVPISGATSSTYAVPASDAGASLAVEVTASIDGGVFGSAVYSQPVTIAGAPGRTGSSGPANTTRPSISGEPAVGSTLTAQPGNWSSDPAAGPVKFSYQWETCSTSGVCSAAIRRAVSKTFKPTSAYLHRKVAVLVTATDTAGSSDAVSDAVTIVRSTKNSPSARSQLERLVRSSDGRRAARVFAAAIPAQQLSQAAKGLLAQYGGEMTPFERSLLTVDEVIGAPKFRAVVSALSSGGKLHAAQAKALRRLFATLAENPALKLLVQKGRALEHNPKMLASYLTAAVKAPSQAPARLPSTGDAALDRIYVRIRSATTSASVVAVDARVRKLLMGAGATRYLRNLPPLWVAALIPPQTLETFALASRQPRALLVNPRVPAPSNAAVSAGLTATEELAQALTIHAAIELLGQAARNASLGLGQIGFEIESLDNLVGYQLTFLGVGAAESGLAAAALPLDLAIEGFLAGGQLTTAGFDLYYSVHPLGLKIYPNANVRMIAGQATTFVVEGLGINLAPLGTEPVATVSMVPNGGPCPAHACTTTVAGPDGVIATMGDAMTSIPVTVLPGPVKKLTLTPTPASATIPTDRAVDFAVAGQDQFGNPVDVSANTTFSISPDPPGWCVANGCGANSPGVYTVTARSGEASQSATMTVTPSPVAYIKIVPAPGPWLVGTEHEFLVNEYDDANNLIGTLGGSAVQFSETLNSTGAPDGPPCDTLGCTANSPGPHTVTATYQVPDTNQTLRNSVSLTVMPNGLAITTANLPSGELGTAYSAMLQASGGTPPYAWSLAAGSTLPTGLALDAQSGAITGTPEQSGSFPITIQLADSLSATTSATFTLDITAQPTITTADLPSGELGTAYSAMLQASGGTPPYAWSLAAGSTLPTGLALDAQSGAITGTPKQPGSFPITIQLADSLGATTSTTFTLDITAPPPVIYVANGADNSVSAIDSTTNTVTATIPLASGASPDGVSVSPDGKFAYVSDGGTGNISVIETSTNGVVATIPVGGEPTGSAVTPDGKYVYVANAKSVDVTVIDTATNAVMTTIPTDFNSGADPRAVTISPDGSLAYVADGYGDDIVVISTASNTTVSDIPLNTANGFNADVVVSPDGQTAYAAYYDTLNEVLGGVATIDTSTDEVDSTYGFGKGVYGLALSPDGQTLYAAQLGGQVSVLTTSPVAVITNIASSTNGYWVSSTPDGKYLYTAGPGNNVTVISAATDAVVATIPVGSGPTALAMTP